MMMNKKAGMQLSINMLVTLIIMIVIFSFGIVLFKTVYDKSVDLDKEVQNEANQRIIDLNTCEELVCVLNPQQEYDGESLTYVIRINNENSVNPQNDFKFEESDCTYSCDDGTLGDCDPDEYEASPALTQGTVSIKNNERDHRLLLFSPKHINCEYSLFFKIQRTGVDYGSTQILWVNT